MADRRFPQPNFGSPPGFYDAGEQAQFRRNVERTLMEVVQYLQDVKVESVTLSSGNNNDYDAGRIAKTLRLTPDATSGSTLTGLQHGADGRVVRIYNVGSKNLTVAHQDANSSAENRFITLNAEDVVLGQNDSVTAEYDAADQRWRVFASGQVRNPRLTSAVHDSGPTTVGSDVDFSIAFADADVLDSSLYTLTFEFFVDGASVDTATGVALTSNPYNHTVTGYGGSTNGLARVKLIRASDSAVLSTIDTPTKAIT